MPIDFLSSNTFRNDVNACLARVDLCTKNRTRLNPNSRMAKADSYVIPVPARGKGVKRIFLYFFRIGFYSVLGFRMESNAVAGYDSRFAITWVTPLCKSFTIQLLGH